MTTGIAFRGYLLEGPYLNITLTKWVGYVHGMAHILRHFYAIAYYRRPLFLPVRLSPLVSCFFTGAPGVYLRKDAIKHKADYYTRFVQVVPLWCLLCRQVGSACASVPTGQSPTSDRSMGATTKQFTFSSVLALYA